jgi:putative flippase GtrA
MRAVAAALRAGDFAGAATQLSVLLNEIWRYALVSLVALAVDYLTFLLVLAIVPHRYLLANVFGFLAGVTIAYAGSVWWVFSVRRYENRMAEFALFAAAGIGGLGMSSIVLMVGVEWLHAGPRVAKIAAVAASFAFNFGVRRALLFASPTR